MSAKPADLVYSLVEQGRGEDALALIEPKATARGASHGELAAYAVALKAVGRLEDALQVNLRATREHPSSAVAEHNTAATYGDLGEAAKAEAACRRAFSKGGDAGATWQVLGRALIGLNRNDEAIAALKEAVKRNPEMGEVQRDLAQLIWMQTGDRDSTAEALTAGVEANPHNPQLAIQLAKALHYGGRPEEALDSLRAAVARMPQPVFELEAAASNIATVVGRSDIALHHAERAMSLRPGDITAGVLACDAYLGLGRPEYVAELGTRLHQRAPNEQQILSRLAAALRMLGDERYPILYDYASVVRAWTIDTPDGWPDLPSYLADLSVALKKLHTFQTHPFDQSLRHGSQTAQDLKQSDDPAIKGFFQAIDGPIRRHMEAIGDGRDPLRRRNTRNYEIAGIWSVMLRPNGFHIDHVHPEGWLSSACYIELPAAVEAGGHEGWIKFGEPGVKTTPPLGPEHFVKPEPGLLALFPSYMWHGTVPFSGDTPRLTVAFDVVPI